MEGGYYVMSTNIDQQVVEMRFDNQHFEKNVKQSMSTIDKLKESLNLTGASKGLERLNDVAKNNNFDTLGKSVDAVKNKFSAMEIVGVTALVNLTNSAVNAGKKFVNALTIEPVTTGFSEYELKMNSVQTIMASTGESLEVVNGYLNELNEYSDKTIYSFSDMTQNIGKFTNAGVKLKDAVLAIKGVSNEAAVSGANANEASRAMYNFAQALSAGYVKLIDWKSIENANMATVEFKEQLLESAVAAGTVTKQADGMYQVLSTNNNGNTMSGTIDATKNFNESLSYQWMTTEVLVNTLRDYADETTEIGKKATQAATEVKTFSMMMDALKESAQSGWAQTWEIIFGDFYKGKDLWTNLNNVIGSIIDKMSKMRNSFLTSALTSSWDKLQNTITTAGFSVDDFTNKLKGILGESKVKKLEKAYGSLSKALEKGKVPIDAIKKALSKLLGTEDKLTNSTKKATKSVKELHSIAKKVINGDFGNGEDRVKKLTKAGYDYAEVQNKVNELLGSNVRHQTKLAASQTEQLSSLTKLTDEQLKNKGYTDEQIKALRDLQDAADGTGQSFDELVKSMNKPSGRVLLLDSIKNVWNEIKKIFDAIGTGISNAFGNPTSDLIGDRFNNILSNIHEFTKAFTISDDLASKISNITEALVNLMALGGSIVSAGLISSIKILNAVLGLFGLTLIDLADIIATYINKFEGWIEKSTLFGSKTGHKKIAQIIVSVTTGIAQCVASFLSLERIRSVIGNFNNWISSFFGSFNGAINFFTIDSVVKKIDDTFDKIDVWVKRLDRSKNFWGDVFNGICTGVGEGLNALLNVARKTGDLIILTISDLTGIDAGSLLSGWNKFIDLIKYVGTQIKECATIFYKLIPVQQIIASFTERLKQVSTVLRESFDLGTTKTIDKFIDKVHTAFESFKKWLQGLNNVSVKELGTHIITGLVNGIAGGIKMVAGAITDIARVIIDTFKALLGIHSPSVVMMTLGGFLISGLILGLTQNAGEVGKFISGFGSTMITWFKNMFNSVIDFAKGINFGQIVSLILTTGLIYTVKKLGDAISLFASPLSALTGMLKSFKGVGDELADTIRAKKLVFVGDAIKSFAVALLILSASLLILSRISWQSIVIGIAAITALAAVLVVLIKALGEVEDLPKLGIQTASIVGVAFGILAIAAAFKMLSSINADDLQSTVIGMVGIIGSMCAVLISLSKITDGAMTDNFKGLNRIFTSLAISLMLMAGVIKLMSLLKVTEILKGTFAISLIAVLFRVFAKSFDGINPESIKQIGNLTLRMSAALLMMAGVIKIISLLSVNEIVKGGLVLVALGLFFKSFVNMLASMDVSGPDKTKAIAKMGNTMIKFSVALVIIAGVMKLLGTMTPNELFKSTAVIYALGALIAAMVHITGDKGANAHKMGIFMLEIATSLILFTTVMLLLKEMDGSGLAKAIGILGIFVAMIGALIYITKYSESTAELQKVLIGISVSLGILATTLVLLSLLDPKKVAMSAAVISGVVGVFGLLMSAASKMDTNAKSWLKIIATLTVMTSAIVVLAFVIKMIAGLEPERALASAESMGILLTTLAASVWIIGKSGKLNKQDLLYACETLGLLSLVIIALSGIISQMKNVDPKSAVSVSIGVGILLLAMAASFKIMSNSTVMDTNSIGRMSMIFGVMVLAIIALGGVISELKGIKPLNAVSAAIALGILITALCNSFVTITYSRVMTTDDALKIAGLLGVMTIVVAALGQVIKGLGNVKPDNAIGSAVALSVLIGALTLCMIPLSTVGKYAKDAVKGAIALSAFAIPLAVFAFTISTMKTVTDAQISSVLQISKVLAAMTVLMVPLTLLSKIKSNIFGTIISLTGMAIPLAVFAVAINNLPDISSKTASIDALTKVMYAMTLLLVPLTILGALMAAFPTVVGLGVVAGIAALTGMVIPLSAFGEELGTLPNLNGKEKTIDTLISVMDKMCDLLLSVSRASVFALVGLVAIEGMVAIVTAFGALATAVGALMSAFPDLEKFTNKGINVLCGISEGLGKVLGSFISGFSEEVLEILPVFGTKLSDFYENAEPFISGIKMVGEDVLIGSKNLSKAILTLLAADFLTAVTSFLSLGSASLPSLGKDLSKFMINALPFFLGIKAVGTDAISSAKNIADMLLAISKAEVLDGIGSLIGASDMSELGEQLKDFGEAIIAFDETVSGHDFDEDAIKAAKNAAELMLALKDAIEPTGGLIQEIMGTKNLGSLGTQLSLFGQGLVAFSKTVSNKNGGSALNTEAMEAAKNAGEMMTALQQGISPVDGVLQTLQGTKGLDTFGEDIKAYAEGLKACSDALVGKNGESLINDEAIKSATKTGSMLAELQAAIPTDKWFDGKISLDDFGEKIQQFGGYIASYANIVGAIKADNVGASTAWAKTLVEVAQTASGFDPDKIQNVEKIKDVGKALKDYGQSISEISVDDVSASVTIADRLANLITRTAGLDTSGVENFKSAVASLASTNFNDMANSFSENTSKLADVGSSMVTSIQNGIKSGSSGLTSTASSIISSLVKTFESKLSSFTTFGKACITNISKGITSGKGSVTTAMASAVVAGYSTAKSYYTSFYSAGSYLVSGMSNGIEANKGKVKEAAKNMAKDAKNAAEKELGIQSPSKVFYKIGGYVVSGFVNAIHDYTSDVITSTKDMADNAKAGFNNAIQKVSDYLNSDMDMQPTIRPVLDLSDVQSGAASIGTMFGNPSLGVMTNLNSINTRMNSRVQNGGNDDIVDAIDKLGALLGNVGGDTYTINGITYDDGSNITDAVKSLVRAARVERRR